MRRLIFVSICLLAVVSVMASWVPGYAHKMHFPQLPDPQGWDIAFDAHRIADDWQCSESGLVTDIHLWVSYRGYNGTAPPPTAYPEKLT